MKIGFVFALMGFGFIGCASTNNDLLGTEKAPGIAKASAPDKTPVTAKSPVAEGPAEMKHLPLTKEQCMAKYPVTVGQLSLRQKCINDTATESSEKMNAEQKAIISGCAEKLLALADSADKAVIAFDVYKSKKQQLRAECNTAIRKAAGAKATDTQRASAKAAKSADPKAPNSKASSTKTAKAKVPSTKGPSAKTTTATASSNAKKPQPTP